MRFDLQHASIHAGWGFSAGCVCIGLATWYSVASFQAGELLHGGSLPALVCGVTAGMIILFEMLLAPRKWLRGWRLIPTKHWMAAHLWFGLASWPLAIIHCGFHLGGGLPSTFMVIFNLTILSGLYGWILQNTIPRLLLKRVRSETIYSQIETVSRRNFADAELLLVRSFGMPAVSDRYGNGEEQFRSEDFGNQSRRTSAVVVGAARDVGKTRGGIFQTSTVQAAPQDAERLWHALSVTKSFLLHGKRSGNEFAIAMHSDRYFSSLRKACDPTSATIIAALEDFCTQRREFDIQQRLHRWMHSWLPVHIGLSVAVTVLLVVHIITSIRYW